ncbi:methyltransferase domain-containing protein [Candidatus Woesearchaeota archaeon]|nr:methyltransferase domain-containing protein [Candidatus Woesearchaeota archaeon]
MINNRVISDLYGLVEESHVVIFEDLLRRHGKGLVLDLGCGARNPSGNKSELVDFLIEMDLSNEAHDFFSKLSLPSNSIFVKADVRKQPFPDSSIDLALMLGLYGCCVPVKEYVRFKVLPKEKWLGYVSDCQDAILKETQRTLSPSGLLISSNSAWGQPIEKTIPQFEKYFTITGIHPGNERYLIVGRPTK